MIFRFTGVDLRKKAWARAAISAEVDPKRILKQKAVSSLKKHENVGDIHIFVDLC